MKQTLVAVVIVTLAFMTGVGCVPFTDDCQTFFEEMPLLPGDFDGNVELANSPPLLFVNQAEMVWNLPSDTATLRIMLGLSSIAEETAILRSQTTEVKLGDSIDDLEPEQHDIEWTLVPDRIVELETNYNIENGPKSYYLNHTDSVAPLYIYSMEIERFSCR
jgi:hypothetical protein